MTERQLPPTTMTVYAQICEWAKRGDKALTVAQMVDKFNMDRSTVTRSITNLCRAGMVLADSDKKQPRAHRYYVYALDKWTDFSEPKKTNLRSCITGCGKSFKSEGAHHRMCDRCRLEQTPHRYSQSCTSSTVHVMPLGRSAA